MKQLKHLEAIINFLLDILKIKPGKLPERATDYWERVFQLSIEFRIYHYLASKVLEQWPDYLPLSLKMKLEKDIFNNKLRNALILLQIIKLSDAFSKNDIPALFIKGAAGLIRDIYQTDLRYLSDIDILVPFDKIKKTSLMLESLNYKKENNKNISPYHHHIEPFYNPDQVAGIEIHFKPYGLTQFDEYSSNHVWEDAEIIITPKGNFLVPSINDHVWILMRTDLVGRSLIHRFSDAIEIIQIVEKGYFVKNEYLIKRAENENIPNIIEGMSYIIDKYWELNLLIENKKLKKQENKLKKWELWSFKTYQKYLTKHKEIKHYVKRFGALKFLPQKSFMKKIEFYRFIFHNEILIENYKRKLLKNKQLIKLLKLLKDILAYIVCIIQYLQMKIELCYAFRKYEK